MTEKTLEAGANRRIRELILGAFAVINLGLFLATSPDGNYQNDSFDYMAVADQFLAHGAFIDPDNPEIASVFRQPGYPLIAAAIKYLFGDPTIPLVLLQILALFGTGLIASRITEKSLGPTYGSVALGLILLNPNLIGLAHTLLPVTFVVLAVTIGVATLLSAACKPSITAAVALGATAAASIYLKPDVKYLILALPIVAPLIALPMKTQFNFILTQVAFGTASLGIALVLLSPWIVEVHQATGKYDVSADDAASHFAVTNVAIIEKHISPALSMEEARQLVRQRVPNEDAPADGGRTRGQTAAILSQVWDYPIDVVLTALAASQVNLFASGGAQNINNIIDVPAFESLRSFHENEEGTTDFVGSWFSELGDASPTGMAVTSVSTLFAITSRLLGIAGIVYMLIRRKWGLALATSGILSYYASIVLFDGISRYRAPVEPVLAIWAAFGVAALVSLTRRQSRNGV